MLYRNLGKNGPKVSALGFGCMRLPSLNKDAQFSDPQVDEPKAMENIRRAIDLGVNYVDTAYPYHAGNSELVVGRALKDGYREKVFLATKMPSWLIQSRNDMDRYLNEQLEKLQTDHIDGYLVHTVNKLFWPNLIDNHLFGFLDDALADGRIRYAGFSFHDEADFFKEVVDAYDWSFCQIQYNYLDENYQAGRSGFAYAAAKGLGVVVMEPLRGGRLASNIPPAVQEVWDRAETKRTPAEWGLRFLWDQPQVSVVLSGMTTMDQVLENARLAGEVTPNSLTPAEKNLIAEVAKIYHARIKVNCTNCRYCLPCPADVNIPGCFTLFNNAYMLDDVDTHRIFYKMHIGEAHKAARCLQCGKCEKACPQKIPIRKFLQEITELFEGTLA
jgi:uncharacterized protein